MELAKPLSACVITARQSLRSTSQTIAVLEENWVRFAKIIMLSPLVDAA
jgi:hypothetical protein